MRSQLFWISFTQDKIVTSDTCRNIFLTLACILTSIVTMETGRDCKITADGNCSHEIKRHLLLGRKAMTNLDSILKSRDITLPTKVNLVKAMVFPVVMCVLQLDHKESWVVNNWCFWTVVLEKTLESPLDCKEIKPINPKGNQFWILVLGVGVGQRRLACGSPWSHRVGRDLTELNCTAIHKPFPCLQAKKK